MGVHSGAAIAGVIGRKAFQYDLCGDSVNTAARMCTFGSPGHVHVSATTHELVRDIFASVCLGEQVIKGKGKMTTYFLFNSVSPRPLFELAPTRTPVESRLCCVISMKSPVLHR